MAPAVNAAKDGAFGDRGPLQPLRSARTGQPINSTEALSSSLGRLGAAELDLYARQGVAVGILGIGRNRILFGNVFDAQAGDFAAATAAGYQGYDPVGAKVSRQGARPGWRVQSARAYGRGGNTSGGGRVSFRKKLVGSIPHPREF